MKTFTTCIAIGCVLAAGTALASHPFGVAGIHLGDDANRDGRGDIFFRAGTALAYSTAGTAGSGAYAGDGGRGYSVVAVSDFDGDGSADVLWSNGSHLKLWINNGSGGYTPVSVGNYGGGWEPFAAEDINGDGKSDLFFRGGTHLAFWLMDGASVISSSYAGDGGVGWRLVAIGSLSGDSKAEVLWADGSQLKVWVVKDAQNQPDGFQPHGVEFYAYLEDRYRGGWAPFAIGDVNGDGLPDILFRTGTHVAYWLLTYVEGQFFPYYEYQSHYGGDGGAGFRAVAVSDYDGDKAADILWSNGSTLKLWRYSSGVGFTPQNLGNYGGGWQPMEMLISRD